MSIHPPSGTNPLTRALATALEGQDAAYARHPSQLRLKLSRLLGDDAHSLRRDIHLVVAALDENVPAELRAAAPLSTADLHRHAQTLAAARGWTEEAGLTAVTLWASAMGLDLSGPAHAPVAEQEPTSPPEQGRFPRGGSLFSSGSDSQGGQSVDGTGLPTPSSRDRLDWVEAGTAGPESAATVLPARRDDPLATDVPDQSSVVAQGQSARAASPHAGGELVSGPRGSQGPGGPPAPWPSSPRFAIAAVMAREGFPIGAYFAFRGGNPKLRYAAMGTFAVIAFGSLLIPSPLIRMVLIVVSALAVLVVPTKLVRNGTMVVDESGFRWYAALSKTGPAELAVPWSQVAVLEGSAPRLSTPSGELWLKPRKGLLPAIASRTQAPVRTTPPTEAGQ